MAILFFLFHFHSFLYILGSFNRTAITLDFNLGKFDELIFSQPLQEGLLVFLNPGSNYVTEYCNCSF